MKKLAYPLILMSFLFVSYLSADNNADEQKAVQQTVNDFIDTFNKHDANSLAEFWANDGDLLSLLGQMAKDKNEVKKILSDDFSGKFKKAQLKATVNNIRLVNSDIAFVDADSTISGMVEDDGTPYAPLHVHAVYLFTKKDGKWKVLAARPY